MDCPKGFLAYNPEELLFGNVFQFLVLQHSGANGCGFSGRQMYGNISFEREPDGEYTQVMLLIQTDTVLELFFEILRSTTANAYLDGGRS